MFPEKMLDVLSHEGCVSILSWGATEEPNLVCTWNSYINLTSDGRLLIPVAGMRLLQTNVAANPKVKLVMASKEVMGSFALGTGFEVVGTASFFDEGAEFDMMYEKFPFMKRLLSVKMETYKQML